MNSETALYIYSRKVAFHETDAAGIAHFSKLLCMVEEAEHEFLRTHGLAILGEDCGWPRVHIEVDFRSPAWAGEVVSIEVAPEEIGESSLEWGFVMYCGEREILRGKWVVVRVAKGGRAATISQEERECLNSGFTKN